MKLLLFFFVIERIKDIKPFAFVRKIFKHHIARVVVIGAVRLSSDNRRYRLIVRKVQETHTQNQKFHILSNKKAL
jgi:hypothetical protein